MAPQEELRVAYQAIDAGYAGRSAEAVGRFIAPEFRSLANDQDRDRAEYIGDLKGMFADLKTGQFKTQVLGMLETKNGTVVTVARRAKLTLKEPIPGMPDEIKMTQARLETWRKLPAGWRMVKQEESALEKELRMMAAADQRARLGDGNTSPETRENFVADVDKAHLPRLKEIIAVHGWPRASKVSSDGAHNMWMLVQHMDKDVAFQKWCLRLMEPLVAEEEANADDFAFLTDRVRVGEKLPQLYGTQWRRNANGEFVPQPIEDEANVESRRRELGMPTMAEYKKQLEAIYNDKG
ncbi:MAG: DUF6624 domain-containing protein [Fimbriimonas sp.]